MYKTTVTSDNVEVIILIEGNVMTSMTHNPESTHYQRYLEWLAAGNSPEPWEG